MISVVSNEIPKEMAALVGAALDNDWEAALALQTKYEPLMEMNFWESSPGPVKCALALMKKCGETLRLPLVPVREDTRKKIEKMLADVPSPAQERGARPLSAPLRVYGRRGGPSPAPTPRGASRT